MNSTFANPIAMMQWGSWMIRARAQIFARCAVIAMTMIASMSSATTTYAGFLEFDTPAVAVQQVNLLNVAATLTAVGNLHWKLDVDPTSHAILPDSTIDAFFQGQLPSEFGIFGLAGAPFNLFTLPDGQFITGDTSQVTVNTTFGIDLFGPGFILLASFYTSDTSLFTSSVSGIPFTSFEFADPNRPNDLTWIYIGANVLPFPISPGSLVGVSFDRTVSSVPEPSSLALAGLGSLGLLIGAFRRRSAAIAI